MGRVKTYDANEIARDIRQTFTAKKEMKERPFDFEWPSHLQHVGDSLAVAYSSDKWQKEGEMVLYKHLAESRNIAYCVPGFLRDFHNPSNPWPVYGNMVSLEDMPMPKHFAILGLFEEIDFQLQSQKYASNRGSSARHKFREHSPKKLPETDEGVVKVTVRHAFVGASKIRWSEISDREDQPFLFIFTKKEGVHIVVTGEELDVRSEGIVGN